MQFPIFFVTLLPNGPQERHLKFDWKLLHRQKSIKIGLANILENRRRVMKKNVAILADSLPLSTSRHNTMFLKNWQHLLYVYFSCVSGTNKSKQHHNKIKREGDFESANQITAKNHNIGERQAPYKRSNNNLANSC